LHRKRGYYYWSDGSSKTELIYELYLMNFQLNSTVGCGSAAVLNMGDEVLPVELNIHGIFGINQIDYSISDNDDKDDNDELKKVFKSLVKIANRKNKGGNFPVVLVLQFTDDSVLVVTHFEQFIRGLEQKFEVSIQAESSLLLDIDLMVTKNTPPIIYPSINDYLIHKVSTAMQDQK